MNKRNLQVAIKTTPKTIARLSKNENVSMFTLGKICDNFDCNIEDIIEHIK